VSALPQPAVGDLPLERQLAGRLGAEALTPQPTRDGIRTLWSDAAHFREVLRFAKHEARPRYPMLWDLTAIDERTRVHREGQPPSDFSVVYHLMSFEHNEDLRIKVPLRGTEPSIPTITDLWANANWYEREVWDLFGIRFDGHPNLRRILAGSSAAQGRPGARYRAPALRAR
jgi:NADH-quinone oxidoreductase subunit C/D